MLQIELSPIATGEIKKAPLAQVIFTQTAAFDPAQRARIITQMKRACDIALNEIPILDASDTPNAAPRYLLDLALEQVMEELAFEGKDRGKTIIDGAPYTVNVKDVWDFNADNGKTADEPKLIAHPRHEAVKNWHFYDDLQAKLKAESATCTRKKTDAVKDYRDAYPDAVPTSSEYSLTIGD